MDVTYSLPDPLTNLWEWDVHLYISPLFADQFGCPLWFCHLEFDKEAIFMVSWHKPVILERDLILSYFKELSFCGPCGPCCLGFFIYKILLKGVCQSKYLYSFSKFKCLRNFKICIYCHFNF